MNDHIFFGVHLDYSLLYTLYIIPGIITWLFNIQMIFLLNVQQNNPTWNERI